MITVTSQTNTERLAVSPEKDSSLITFAIPDISIGGAEIVTVTLAKWFLGRGFRVDIVACRDIPEPKLAVPSPARYIALGATRTRHFLLPFARYLRRERPAAVVGSMWPLTSACVLAHRLVGSRARIVVCEHSTQSVQYADRGAVHQFLMKESIALTYPLADARVAVSSGVADDLATLSGISRNSISVIYNPLSTRSEAATKDAKAEAVWGGWRGPRIITVARLTPPKNHALLIRAFKRMLAVHDARLLILGSGEMAEATAAVARAEGVAEKVLMPGATIDPTPYYHSADLFVLSSDREGLPGVIIEALSCGVPIVSTDCRSGPSEILENGRYGRLVPVGDAIALAQAMVESLSARHDRAELKRRAGDFAPELIADQYLALIFPHHTVGTAT